MFSLLKVTFELSDLVILVKPSSSIRLYEISRVCKAPLDLRAQPRYSAPSFVILMLLRLVCYCAEDLVSS